MYRHFPTVPPPPLIPGLLLLVTLSLSHLDMFQTPPPSDTLQSLQRLSLPNLANLLISHSSLPDSLFNYPGQPRLKSLCLRNCEIRDHPRRRTSSPIIYFLSHSLTAPVLCTRLISKSSKLCKSYTLVPRRRISPSTTPIYSLFPMTFTRSIPHTLPSSLSKRMQTLVKDFCISIGPHSCVTSLTAGRCTAI